MKSIEDLENKIIKIKEENRDYRKKIAGLKKEISEIKKDLRYKNILHNNTPAGIILIRDKIILEVNDTFLEMMGYEYEEVINRNYFDFIDAADLIDIRKRYKKWDSEKVKRDQYDAHFIKKTGDSVICSVESKRIRYRRRASYVLNITGMEEREKDQDTKKREIRTDTMKSLLKGFRKEKNKDAAFISEMIAMIDKSISSPDLQLKELISNLESRTKIFQKQDYMLKLITDDTGDEFSNSRFNINNVIQDAVNSIMDHINENEDEPAFNTYFRSLSIIEGNPDDFKEAFAQILIYLTENMAEEGDLLITTEENADFAYIYIQDNSAGKGEDSADSLFYPYYETNRHGLAFSKAVIERHNGTLEAITGKGEGVTFQIVLPLAPKIELKKKIDKSRLKKSRILIIQDDDVARDLMSHLLRDRGCRLDTSNNFLEGLAKIKKNKIDMVIADADSIEMDMNNFLKKCRTLKPGMLTVFIGDRKGRSDMNENVSVAPDLFISKPLEIKNAVKKISRLLMTEN